MFLKSINGSSFITERACSSTKRNFELDGFQASKGYQTSRNSVLETTDHYLTTLFHLEGLFSAEHGKMMMNNDQIRMWKE